MDRTIRQLKGHRYHDLLIGKMALVAEDSDAKMVLTYVTVAVATSMLSAITATGLFLSVHTASPGNTGANEIVPGTGYTGNRPAIAWAAFSVDHQTSSNTQTFPLLATQAGGIPFYGLWTAATAGTFVAGGPTAGLGGSIPNGANVTFTNGVTLTATA